MTVKTEQLALPFSGTPEEESLPPVVRELRAKYDTARPGGLRAKKVIPELGRLLKQGEITLEQYDGLTAYLAEQRANRKASPQEPIQVPESPSLYPGGPLVDPEAAGAITELGDWSPTANLPPERTEFTAQERAAGEHLSRQQ